MSDKTMKKVSKVFPQPVRTPSARSSKRSLAREEGGAIAVMLALMLAALIGMMGLAMDLGKVWNLETQLQHAADACALAGVTQIDGSAGSRVRAIQAAISEMANNRQRFADDNVDADALGGADGVDIEFDTTITIDGGTGIADNRDIKFYAELPIEPANIATSDGEARLIECNVLPRTATFSFAAVVGAVNSASPGARAVAGYEIMVCDKPQMMMCNPAETLDEEGDSNGEGFDLYADCDDNGRFGGLGSGDPRNISCTGRGITMKEHGGGGQLSSGEFGFLSLSVIDFDGSIIEQIVGANVLKDFLAEVGTGQECAGNYVQTEPGDMASLGKWINFRFDMYHDDAYRDDPNYRPARNVIKDLVLEPGWVVGGSCRYNTTAGSPAPGSSDWILPPNPYDGPGWHRDPIGFPTSDVDFASPRELDTMGYPRDYCAYLTEAQAALVGGTTPPSVKLGFESEILPSGTATECIFAPPASVAGLVPDRDQIGTGQWDVETYMEIQHPGWLAANGGMAGLIAAADLPNVTEDTSNDTITGKDGFVSRWELYQWEMLGFLNIVTPGNMPEALLGDEGFSICYQDGTANAVPVPTLDRRIMTMAVVNCAGVKGGRRVIERVSGHGTVAIFLTEPMGGFDSDAMYAEIVDPAGLAGAGAEAALTLIRNHIVLIE